MMQSLVVVIVFALLARLCLAQAPDQVSSVSLSVSFFSDPSCTNSVNTITTSSGSCFYDSPSSEWLYVAQSTTGSTYVEGFGCNSNCSSCNSYVKSTLGSCTQLTSSLFSIVNQASNCPLGFSCSNVQSCSANVNSSLVISVSNGEAIYLCIGTGGNCGTNAGYWVENSGQGCQVACGVGTQDLCSALVLDYPATGGFGWVKTSSQQNAPSNWIVAGMDTHVNARTGICLGSVSRCGFLAGKYLAPGGGGTPGCYVSCLGSEVAVAGTFAVAVIA